ncbi:MAG: energy-coupling factor transporter transmembrane protein EcfT, partial [Methanomicrobiales archaeon]|nr:energy-coupling factor transporter transmembrane protein EcfT [Methanomicrobiales archaeon]
MIEEIFYIEKQACRDSMVHRVDARVKLLAVLGIIVAVVAFPLSINLYLFGALLSVFFGVCWIISGISPWIYLKRLALILPFGISLIIFQIFFKNRYYVIFHPIFDLPLGIHV